LASPISEVDVVGIPSSDTARSREFYVEILGLKPDENAWNEFWVAGPASRSGSRRASAASFVHHRYAPYPDGTTP
jgi:catechol 2,3-dioxygenase-like lactoylglutathione lyase family enzyme